MNPRKKIAVAGATGRLGRHIVDILQANEHDVVVISRSSGVDVITRVGLAQALSGVECVIDAATSPSPEQQAATEFFVAAARSLQEVGEQTGVRHIVGISIIGCDQFKAGYNAAKFAHEQALMSGPLPVHMVRAAQFHELVAQYVAWGRQGEVIYVPNMRTQLVAARTVARVLADLAVGSAPASRLNQAQIPEIAGPQEENLAAMVRLLVAWRGDRLQVEEISDSTDPDHELYEHGGLLPHPHATLVGPTFAEWLDSTHT